MAKLIFFDIDGTLYRHTCGIPESARRAIECTVANGNYVMLCTGRNHSMIPSEVATLPISGEVAGCGTYVAVGEQVLTEASINGDICYEILAKMEALQCAYYIENADYFYFNDACLPAYYANATEEIKEKMSRNYPGRQKPWSEYNKKLSKITGYPQDRSLLPQIKEALAPWFDVIIHKEYEYIEIMLRGYSKGNGVREIMKHLHIKYEDTYAYGDSMNDLSMLEAVAHGMVMAEASEELKKKYPVTTSIYDHGIARGMYQMGLITEEQLEECLR